MYKRQYICPTCYCFDIQDYGHHEQGERFRCWDSCQFSQYTLTAGGNNPRPTRKERVRNRFLHKLQFFPEKHGQFGCVGCGRCLDVYKRQLWYNIAESNDEALLGALREFLAQP